MKDSEIANLRFGHLTRGDLAELAPGTIAVVPLGSIEQHGPHLPVCADTAIVTALAERAAEQAALEIPVVVAPTLPFGFAHHHLPFGGTISIDLTTYINVITSIGSSLAASGFRRILFLNGHGGNDGPIRVVGDRLVVQEGLDIHVAAASYWTCAKAALAILGLDVGPAAPRTRRQLRDLLPTALHPELSRRPGSRRPNRTFSRSPGQPCPVPSCGGRIRGRSATAAPTTRGWRPPISATRILTAITDQVARFIIDFHLATDAEPESSRDS